MSIAAGEQIRGASDHFYAALNKMVNGDPQPLAGICSHGTEITTMHPIGGRQVGWKEVEASWAGVAELASDGKVELKHQHVHATADMGYEVGVEHVSFLLGGERVTGEMRVTNIYQRESGGWRLVHHHTDPAPAMVAALQRRSPST